MTSILILNTAWESSRALVWREGALFSRHARVDKQSAQTILQLAMDALDEAGLNRADAVAVLAGPGGFTGTRIGVAAAQGLCAAWDAPGLPMSTLALNAAAAMRQHPAQAILVGLRAPAESLFFACYQDSADGLVLRGDEQAGALADLRLDAALARDWLAVGDGWPRAGAIEKHFGIRLRGGPVKLPVADVDLATLAHAMWRRKQFTSADCLRPNYVAAPPRFREQAASD